MIGFGRIARAFSLQAVALGMAVRAYDPHAPGSAFEDSEVQRVVDLPALLAWADVVSLHAPLTDETRGIINATALANMRRDSFLVNVARGGLVDQQALVDALRRGSIAGAALDVLDTEPAEAADPILHVEGIVVTPHVAWESSTSYALIFQRAALQVAAVLSGREPSDVVGRPTTNTSIQ